MICHGIKVEIQKLLVMAVFYNEMFFVPSTLLNVTVNTHIPTHSY